MRKDPSQDRLNPSPRAGDGLGEPIGAFFLISAALCALYHLRRVLPFIDANLSALAAVLFLYVPASLIWRRGSDLEHYGLPLPGSPGVSFPRLLLRAAGIWLGCVAVVFPLFVLGYWIYLHRVCMHLPRFIALCSPLPVPGLHLPPDLPMAALGQLLVVALPEEFFFRGYLQGALARRLSAPAAVLLSALLFAVGHVLVSFDPGTLAVFFPGLLFGILRAYSGSILAGTLFHASCNLLIDILHRSLG